MFQSSPAIAGGCYKLLKIADTSDLVFQSSPAIAGGCYHR